MSKKSVVQSSCSKPKSSLPSSPKSKAKQKSSSSNPKTKTKPSPSSSTPGSNVIHFPFLPQVPLDNVIYSGKKVVFNNTESSTVCIDSEILRNKVYLLDLICEGFISVGLVLKERIPSIHTKGPFGELGSCFVWNTRYVSVGDTSDTRQTGDKHWDEKCPVPVRLELDTEVSPHILYIFAAGKQALPIITNIPTNVCFAFGCYEADTDLTHSVEVKQLQIQTGKAKGDSAKGKIYAWQD